MGGFVRPTVDNHFVGILAKDGDVTVLGQGDLEAIMEPYSSTAHHIVFDRCGGPDWCREAVESVDRCQVSAILSAMMLPARPPAFAAMK
jgi:hypothetical protein